MYVYIYIYIQLYLWIVSFLLPWSLIWGRSPSCCVYVISSFCNYLVILLLCVFVSVCLFYFVFSNIVLYIRILLMLLCSLFILNIFGHFIFIRICLCLFVFLFMLLFVQGLASPGFIYVFNLFAYLFDSWYCYSICILISFKYHLVLIFVTL